MEWKKSVNFVLLWLFVQVNVTRAQLLSQSFTKVTEEFTKFQSLKIGFYGVTITSCGARCLELTNQCFSFIFQYTDSYCELGSKVMSSATARDMNIDVFYCECNNEGMDIIFLSPACNGTTTIQILNSSSGVVRSPKIPKDYSYNVDCSWLVQASIGDIIVLKIVNLSTECGVDNFTVYNGKNTKASKLFQDCSLHKEYSVESTSNILLVKFKANKKRTDHQSFLATYSIFNFDFKTAHIQSGLNQELAIQCIVKNTDIRNDKYTITRMEISKFEQDKWNKIAAVKTLKDELIDVYDAGVKEVKWNNSDNIKTNGFLQIKWKNSTDPGVLGNYRCKAEFSGSFKKEKSLIISAQDQVSQTIEPSGIMTDRLPIKSTIDNVTTWPVNTDIWPNGNFGLLAPLSGCPVDSSGGWYTGFKYVYTESSDIIIPDNMIWRTVLEETSDGSTLGNFDAVSENSHLLQPFLISDSDKKYFRLQYCVRNDNVARVDVWPSGSYCINKKGACPEGFANGKVYIDEEDSLGNYGFVKGVVPDDNLSGTHWFCCRGDGSSQSPVHLPNKSPFYLYRYGGRCQLVTDMHVEEEFVLLDSEDNDNNDQVYGTHPDIKLNDFRLELCYYEPLK